MNGEPIPIEDENSSETSDWIMNDIENDTATCPETQGYESLLRMSGDSITEDDDNEPEGDFESVLQSWRNRETEARRKAHHIRDTCVDSSSRNNKTDMSAVT